MTMAEKILVAQNGYPDTLGLAPFLSSQGYSVIEASTLSDAGSLVMEGVHLAVLDVDLTTPEGGNEWVSLRRSCEDLDLPCLIFSSGGAPQEHIRKVAPWAQEVIRKADDEDEILSKIKSQLKILHLYREVDQLHNLLRRTNSAVTEYRQSAAQIQKSLLPSHLPETRNLKFDWRFLPCETVGGDLFNVAQISEDTVMVYLVDVSGHGISAAMVTVAVHQTLSLPTGRVVKKRIETPPYYRIPPPSEVLAELDEAYPFERFEKFFTITYLLINIRTGKLLYSNGGHPPPILVEASGSLQRLDHGGPIIGMGTSASFTCGELQMNPGDRIYLYSDGITEYTDENGDMYGEERFCIDLRALKERPLSVCCEKIIEHLFAFGQDAPQKDDVTLLGIEFLGSDHTKPERSP